MTREQTHDLDQAVLQAARPIRVLSSIAWRPEHKGVFLGAWRQGRRELPRPETPPQDLSAEVEALEELGARCDPGDPAEAFIAATARSYATAGRMLGAIGTPRFTEHSIASTGGPTWSGACRAEARLTPRSSS